MNPTKHPSSLAASRAVLSRRTLLGAGIGLAASTLLPGTLRAAAASRRVVVWAEGTAPDDKVYPQDVNTAIAEGLKQLGSRWQIEIAGLKDPEQGCSADSLQRCDVLIWWGHKKHGEVKDECVDRIVRRVRDEGMGFISLHSSHFAKPNKRLMNTACSWGAYVIDGCKLKVVVRQPGHPIAKGLKDFILPQVERYSEPYAVPDPEAVPFEGVYVYPDGKEEKTRVGLCWTIGKGRMFYFAPGHETYRDFYLEEVRRLLANAVEWAAPNV